MNDRDLGRLGILHRRLCPVPSLYPMCIRGPYISFCSSMLILKS